MKPVRASILGLAATILVISGCSTSGSCKPAVSDQTSISNSACGTARLCKPPMWYWSNGRYIPFIDDLLTKYSARSCAVKSLSRTEMRQCARDTDFCQGYIQAYEDLALGSRGVIPAVPPPRYWKAHNRSIRGHSKVDQWYAGYRAGLSQSGYQIADEQTTIQTSHEHDQNEQSHYGNYY